MRIEKIQVEKRSEGKEERKKERNLTKEEYKKGPWKGEKEKIYNRKK